MKPDSPLTRRILRGLLMALVSLLLLGAFFLAVIMGQPQGTPAPKAQQTLPAPLAAPVLIAEAAQLSALTDVFPAPVMAAMSTGTLKLQQGVCQDVPFEDGVARVVTLIYRAPAETEVTVQSIYPARALDVMGKGDYVLTGTAGHPLAGLRSIRMERPGQVRMHAQSDNALYVVTLPEATSSVLRQLTSVMQLYQGD